MEGEVSPSANESMQSKDEGTPTTLTKVWKRVKEGERNDRQLESLGYVIISMLSRPGIVCSTTKRSADTGLGCVLYNYITCTLEVEPSSASTTHPCGGEHNQFSGAGNICCQQH